MTRSFTPVLAFALLACSSESSTRETAADGGNEILFASTDFTLQPGDEKYMCWAGNLPADRDIDIRSIRGDYGEGTHHVFFAWTLAPEPDGMTECPVLFKTTWIPIYLGGKNTSPLALPDGAAIEMGKGKQLVLQLHLQNTTTKAIVNRVTMHLELGEPGKTYTPAGVFGIDNRVIDLPAMASDVHTSMSCKPGKEMNVFSVLGHMHKLGKTLDISQNGKNVFHEPWNFDEQPITPLALTVKAEDELGLECVHSNTHDKAVTYGESSDTEMCATILYYTPYDQLDGCINAPSLGDAGAKPSGDGGGGPRVVGNGACTNDADLALVGQTQTNAAIQTCGTSCLGQPAQCATDCISKDSGLSSACSACFSDMVSCTIAQCISDCAADPGGAACDACRTAKCVPAFTACSGLGG